MHDELGKGCIRCDYKAEWPAFPVQSVGADQFPYSSISCLIHTKPSFVARVGDLIWRQNAKEHQEPSSTTLGLKISPISLFRLKSILFDKWGNWAMQPHDGTRIQTQVCYIPGLYWPPGSLQHGAEGRARRATESCPLTWEYHPHRSEHSGHQKVKPRDLGSDIVMKLRNMPMHVLGSWEGLLMTHLSWPTASIQKFLLLEYLLLKYLQVRNGYSSSPEGILTSGNQEYVNFWLLRLMGHVPLLGTRSWPTTPKPTRSCCQKNRCYGTEEEEMDVGRTKATSIYYTNWWVRCIQSYSSACRKVAQAQK